MVFKVTNLPHTHSEGWTYLPRGGWGGPKPGLPPDPVTLGRCGKTDYLILILKGSNHNRNQRLKMSRNPPKPNPKGNPNGKRFAMLRAQVRTAVAHRRRKWSMCNGRSHKGRRRNPRRLVWFMWAIAMRMNTNKPPISINFIPLYNFFIFKKKKRRGQGRQGRQGRRVWGFSWKWKWDHKIGQWIRRSDWSTPTFEP